MIEPAKFEPICPTCDRKILMSSDRKSLPFCSQRCRLVDLGRWLDERHALPSTPNEDDESADENNSSEIVRTPLGWDDP